MKKLIPLLAAGRVAAWYWGHEHSCTRYDLHEQWKMYGRCVGHSGFPYFRRFKDLLSKVRAKAARGQTARQRQTRANSSADPTAWLWW